MSMLDEVAPAASAGESRKRHAAPVPKALDVVLLGAGRVVSEYYLPALAATGIANSITIVDSDRACLDVAQALSTCAHCIPQDYRSYLDGLAAESPPLRRRLVIVALPNQFHVEACERIVASGRDLLCEKPLSLSAADCRRLGELAAVNGLRLSVAMVRRYLPSWLLAQQMVKSGELGRIVSLEVHDCAPFAWRPRSFAFFAPGAGGILADMGVHYLDLLDLLAGPLTPVAYEDDWRGGNESSCRYRLSTSGIDIELVLSRIDPAGAFMRLTGEKGTLTVRKSSEADVVHAPRGLPERRLSLDRPYACTTWPANLSGAFCQLLLDHARDAESPRGALANAFDAERVSALIEWAYAHRQTSARSGPSGHALATIAPETLITGGTGFIGGHLVERLHGQGAQMRCCVRSPATVANLTRYPVQLDTVDLRDTRGMRSAMKGVRTVYHLAYGKEGPEATSVTIDGTKSVVEAAIEAGVEAVVVLSTAYVFGFPSAHGAVDETVVNNPYGGTYGESKSVTEAWCLERARTCGRTRIVVLNPTCVFGPGGGAYTTLPVSLAKSGGFAWFDGGKGLCNYTYVANVVDAILRAAATPAAHGMRFIINDGTMSWKEFLGPFVSEVSTQIPSYGAVEFRSMIKAQSSFSLRDFASAIMGSPTVRAAARRSRIIRYIGSMSFGRHLRNSRSSEVRLPDWVGAGHVQRTPVPPEWLPDLYHSYQTTFSAARAAKVLGWSPHVPWEEARDRTLHWLKAAGYYNRE